MRPSYQNNKQNKNCNKTIYNYNNKKIIKKYRI